MNPITFKLKGKDTQGLFEIDGNATISDVMVSIPEPVDVTPPIITIEGIQDYTTVDNSELILHGIVTDDATVRSVDVQVNDGAWVLAALERPNWNLTITLAEGLNNIKVRAYDISNNSAIKTIALNYVKPIPVPEPIPTTNLIKNPGFENGAEKPINWELVQYSNSIPEYTTESHSGSKAIKISLIGTIDMISGEPRSDYIQAFPNQAYKASAWVKTQGLGGTNMPTVRVVELDAAKNWIRQNNLPVFGKDATDWTQKSLEFTTQPNTAYMYMYANIWNGNGTFWLDDVELVLVGTPSNPIPAPIPDPVPEPIPDTTSTYNYVSPFNKVGESIVKVLPDKTLSINGKRVFPQTFITICKNTISTEQNAANLKRMQVYTADMVGYGYRSSDLPAYVENGVGVMPMVGHFPVNSPALFGYYQTDEPELPKHASCKQIYDDIKSQDPNHIVLTGVWHDGIQWEDTADVIWFGLYPYKDAAWIRALGTRDETLYKYEYIVKTNILLGTQDFDTTTRPFWPVLQALSAPDDASALPTTKEETKALIYTALTMNVKGLAYWSYSWTPNDSGLWKDQQKVSEHIAIANEINSISDILLLPTKDYSWEFHKGNGSVKFSNNPVKWRGYQQLNYLLKRFEATHYLIVVNKDAMPITTSITISGLTGSATVIELGLAEAGSIPGRTIPAENGQFMDVLLGLGVKIYQII